MEEFGIWGVGHLKKKMSDNRLLKKIFDTTKKDRWLCGRSKAKWRNQEWQGLNEAVTRNVL